MNYSAHVGYTEARARKALGLFRTLIKDVDLEVLISYIAAKKLNLPLLIRLRGGNPIITYESQEIFELKKEAAIYADNISDKKQKELSFLLECACDFASNHKMNLYFFVTEMDENEYFGIEKKYGKFSLGDSGHGCIEIDIMDYERELVGEYYDDNWVRGNVSVIVGGFTGKFNAAFLSEDFSRFLEKLNKLYESLSGKAEFTTMEGQLLLEAEGDGKGHIRVRGEAIDVAGTGNRLVFNFEIDQIQLAQTIKELKHVVSDYPVRSA